MTPNNNINVLAFYDSLEKQNHRKHYAYGSVFSLPTPDRKILPFQIWREESAATIESVKMFTIEGVEFADITAAMVATGLEIVNFAEQEYDLIIYPGYLSLPDTTTPEGLYWIQIRWYIGETVVTKYSEVFNIVRSVDHLLKITYWEDERFDYPGGHIDYAAPYKSIIYLESEIGKPDYPNEEGVSKRNGYKFYEYQISEKKYRFDFLAPEYLCDAIRFIKLHDHIEVTFAGETYEADDILFSPDWEKAGGEGSLALVEAEFTCGTVVKKLAKATVYTDNGDFNRDFNNDYDLS